MVFDSEISSENVEWKLFAVQMCKVSFLILVSLNVLNVSFFVLQQ